MVRGRTVSGFAGRAWARLGGSVHLDAGSEGLTETRLGVMTLWGSECGRAGLLWAEREQLDGAFSFFPAAQERTGGAGLARGPSRPLPSSLDSLWQALAGGHACRPCGFPA